MPQKQTMDAIHRPKNQIRQRNRKPKRAPTRRLFEGLYKFKKSVGEAKRVFGIYNEIIQQKGAVTFSFP